MFSLHLSRWITIQLVFRKQSPPHTPAIEFVMTWCGAHCKQKLSRTSGVCYHLHLSWAFPPLQICVVGSLVTPANLTFEVFSKGSSLTVSGENISNSLVMQGMVPGLRFKDKELLAARGSLGVAVKLQRHPVLTTAVQGNYSSFRKDLPCMFSSHQLQTYCQALTQMNLMNLLYTHPQLYIWSISQQLLIRGRVVSPSKY